MSAPISAIYGVEPMREGEYPAVHIVGSQSLTPQSRDKFTVSRIERREDNFGDHGLLWFDVFDAAGNLATSMQGRAVGEIHYALEKAEPDAGDQHHAAKVERMGGKL